MGESSCDECWSDGADSHLLPWGEGHLLIAMCPACAESLLRSHPAGLSLWVAQTFFEYVVAWPVLTAFDPEGC